MNILEPVDTEKRKKIMTDEKSEYQLDAEAASPEQYKKMKSVMKAEDERRETPKETDSQLSRRLSLMTDAELNKYGVEELGLSTPLLP